MAKSSLFKGRIVVIGMGIDLNCDGRAIDCVRAGGGRLRLRLILAPLHACSCSELWQVAKTSPMKQFWFWLVGLEHIQSRRIQGTEGNDMNRQLLKFGLASSSVGRVASCECELKVASWEVRVDFVSCELQNASWFCELWIASWIVRVANIRNA